MTGSPGDNGTRLAWAAVPGATRYKIYRTDGELQCNFGKTIVGETTGTIFTDAGLQNGREYSYLVAGFGASDSCMGRASACVSVTPDPIFVDGFESGVTSAWSSTAPSRLGEARLARHPVDLREPQSVARGAPGYTRPDRAEPSPMDFEIPPATEQMLARARAFVETALHPLEPVLFAGRHGEAETAVMALRPEVRRLGLWAPGLSGELGGMGLGLVELGLFSEAVGGSPLGHLAFGCQAPDAGNLEILDRHGSPAQRERWLGPLAAGEIRSCFAMTEPESPGSNPVVLATRAEEAPASEGGGWTIDGHKWFVSSAQGAALSVVMAVTDPEAEPHRRASMLLVPADAPGFEIVRNLPVMGEAGGGWFSHAEVRLSGCRVGPEALLGERGRGFAIAQERLGPGRIHHCMRWLGICARALALMCRRAAGREIAPGERLADRDLVRAWIAECAAEIAAARLLTLHTAWTIERRGWRAAQAEISMIKFQVAATLGRVLDRALQVHGGLGMLDDTPLAWFYRHERAARIYDGPDEVHKLALARRLLAPYR